MTAAQQIASSVTEALGGFGLFGVELFIRGDQVLFSEVSPRPHDTGMVTMATQQLSEFALHVRAVLGLPVPDGVIPIRSAGASAVVLAERESQSPLIGGVSEALAAAPESDLRLFGKPDSRPGRRMELRWRQRIALSLPVSGRERLRPQLKLASERRRAASH